MAEKLIVHSPIGDLEVRRRKCPKTLHDGTALLSTRQTFNRYGFDRHLEAVIPETGEVVVSAQGKTRLLDAIKRLR